MTDLLHQAPTGSDFVVQALSRDLDRLVAIGTKGERLTARGLAEGISRMQQVFESLEPRPRRAALLSRNRLDILPVNSGLAFAGVVATALHPMGSVDDYLYVLEDAEVDLLIYDADHYEETAAALKACAPGLKHVLAMGGEGVGRNIGEAAAAFAPKPLTAPVVAPDSLSRIAYSGGTTGKPKGIMCSHGSTATSTLIQLTSWECPSTFRHLICAPLSHAGASMFNLILLKGGYMVVVPGFEPVAVMQAIQEHRITSVLMVPTMVIAMIDHPRFAEFDLSSLEIIYYGASAFPAARLKDAIGKLGSIFFQFYGQAEAPMSVTVMRRDEHLVDSAERLASCGRPTPLVRVALMDDDLNEVPVGTPGEICVQGPLVNLGYLNKPEETEKVFEGGWLHTGDVAIRGEDGFFRIVDRKKDMIVTGGFNVFAREVEDVLTEHPSVRQAAVIGVPDPKWGEAVKAIVVLEPGANVDEKVLIASVRERKGSVQAPKSVEFVDALPVTPLGKPDKKALRMRYAAVAA
ncbi:AMP-binding protein [Novosphingobium sp. G106]|uniref:AMP-binding protein n=1 Tax=Novosphingobium sp. G106 TaxID=2849500 RepID=UPI001C2CFC8E|nr:AMP-binding protein [Novosphingobium sp. G106]MBV1691268.1 AMP-binding protein [Novosphingobium sp. G106]